MEELQKHGTGKFREPADWKVGATSAADRLAG
jgi:hypothetical protein